MHFLRVLVYTAIFTCLGSLDANSKKAELNFKKYLKYEIRAFCQIQRPSKLPHSLRKQNGNTNMWDRLSWILPITSHFL